MNEIVVLPDAATLAREAADRFVSLAHAALGSRGQFMVALSGGSTPRAMYEHLIDAVIDWSRVHFFWGDERCVPPDHPDSNYRMAYQALLSKIAVPDQNIHRMKGELEPAQAAAEYEGELRRVFKIDPPLFPRFDLILLGMGTEAHTASLFPDTHVIHEQQRWVIGHHIEQLKANRITLTPPVINRAAQVLFLVAGADKAAPLQSVVRGPHDPDRFPAQIIEPIDGKMIWLVDQTAASSLNLPQVQCRHYLCH